MNVFDTTHDAELSELEFGMLLAYRAFERWNACCMSAAGVAGLSVTDILVLRTLVGRNRSRTLGEICIILGIEDVHVANYAIRKLEAAGLVTTGRAWKEKVATATEAGAAASARFAELQAKVFSDEAGARDLDRDNGAFGMQLRRISSLYGGAARKVATSFGVSAKRQGGDRDGIEPVRRIA